MPSWALPVNWELFCLGSLYPGQPAWPKGAAPCAGLWVLADWSLWARHGWSLAFSGQPWVLPGRCVCVRIWVMCVCNLPVFLGLAFGQLQTQASDSLVAGSAILDAGVLRFGQGPV